MTKPKKKPGRPATTRERRNVYLEEKHIEALREYGGGSLSAGIRIVTERHIIGKGTPP